MIDLRAWASASAAPRQCFKICTAQQPEQHLLRSSIDRTCPWCLTPDDCAGSEASTFESCLAPPRTLERRTAGGHEGAHADEDPGPPQDQSGGTSDHLAGKHCPRSHP